MKWSTREWLYNAGVSLALCFSSSTCLRKIDKTKSSRFSKSRQLKYVYLYHTIKSKRMLPTSSTALKALALSFLLNATTTNSAAISPNEAHRAKTLLSRQDGNDFRVIIYNNAQCTGSANTFDGDGPQCLRALGSGGAGAQLIYLDPDGVITFWSGVGCQGDDVDSFLGGSDPTSPECIRLMGNPLSVEYELQQ